MSDADWDPLYVEFARENGRTPEEQFAHDGTHPFDRRTDFIIWANRRAEAIREAIRKAAPRP